ncbi:hypothetical protein D9757_001462 [Collybiopsis confluens]|uniref:Uncharacterized protein n=1 Tax=Collybiopsis confluens TaxID=2823264 RepID=A0A8H5HZS0_9AGAR|nr:hypothetical protein D9757_001462 [Collybiopsis confluens]
MAVRVYQVHPQSPSQSHGIAMYHHQAPVLSVCWNEAIWERVKRKLMMISFLLHIQEGNKIFSGSVDNMGLMFDAVTGQSTPFAQHDGAVKAVKWIYTPYGGVVATGSWDKTVKAGRPSDAQVHHVEFILQFWDLRSPVPISTTLLPERCYTLDAQYPFLVVGTADRRIPVFDLGRSTTSYTLMMSSLRKQTRVVSCCTGGFAAGGVEGRVAFQHVEEKNKKDDYTFKCHRQDLEPNVKDQSLVYSINDINFHPVHGTFSTCGLNRASGPIVCSTFNSTGTLFVYAVSYDWYRGFTGMTTGHPNKLMVHLVKDEEVRKRVLRK